VAKSGLSVSLGEMFSESAAVAAPIWGAQGGGVAAIAIGAPTQRLQAKLELLEPVLAEVAARASGIDVRTDPGEKSPPAARLG
jgi:IclR family transcriptional regulator, acetate operon repressor